MILSMWLAAPALIREARGVILEAIEFRAGYTCRVTPNSDEPTCRSDASRRHHAMSWQQLSAVLSAETQVEEVDIARRM